MKNFFLGLLIAAVVAFGVAFLLWPKAPQNVGGIGQSGAFNPFAPVFAQNGLSYSSITSINRKSATTSPAALGKASSGFIAVPAATTVFFASSSVLDLNSRITFTQIASATDPSLVALLGSSTCNTTAVTSTPLFTLYPAVSSTTATSTLPGFKMTLTTPPLTNPDCFGYHIGD